MIPAYKAAGNVRMAANDDGAVLLNLDSGLIFSLNGVGARIWGMLENRMTPELMVISLEREFGISQQQLSGDLEAFLRDLEARELVSRDEAPKFQN
jgi:hypothetical protein